ncbi:calmodulin [Pseudoalteromonas pernae]|uniref:calmodulin n=1 Tax=Pseudoalteromonas pernae TaxID=3118054 RepID=UPI00324293C7
MKKVNQVIALAALTSASAAFALDATFESVDLDSNNSISMEEASKLPELMSQFKELDVNTDGELSREEFAAAE